MYASFEAKRHSYLQMERGAETNRRDFEIVWEASSFWSSNGKTNEHTLGLLYEGKRGHGMTCKECLHNEVCTYGENRSNGMYCTGDKCKQYKSTADVVEVRHGTWYHGTEYGSVYAKCSACGTKMNYYCYGYAYCALCGAKMDGEGREDK